MLCSLEDLQLEAKQDLTNLSQGRRLQLTLGGQGKSRFSYRAFVLDSRSQSGPFVYHCGVFIVPKVCLNMLSVNDCAKYMHFFFLTLHCPEFNWMR